MRIDSIKEELIKETHKEWLKKNFNATFEEVKAMTDEKADMFCNSLMMLEGDALLGERDDLEIINEVQDIIFDKEPDDSCDNEK